MSILETSGTSVNLPSELNNKIVTSMNSRYIPNNIFEESSAWISQKLSSVIIDYLQSSKVSDQPSKPKCSTLEQRQIKIINGDHFVYNLDFCFAITCFKSNYGSKSPSERVEEINSIVQKFLLEDKPKITVTNPENYSNVLKILKSGSPKIDMFDKLLADVAEVLNVTAKNIHSEPPLPEVKPAVNPPINDTSEISLPNSPLKGKEHKDVKETKVSNISELRLSGKWRPRSKPLNDQNESLPSRNSIKSDLSKSVKLSEIVQTAVYIRVTDRDPKTDLVKGRIWKLHYYKSNSEGTKLTCHLSPTDTKDIPELSVDITKLSSNTDIIESEHLSEPENSKFAWSILPLKLLYASPSREERTNWISYLNSKISSSKLSLSDSLRDNSSTTTSSTTNESDSNDDKFSIVLRRFNKRGGVRIPVPDTMEKLLQVASEKLKINAVRLREVDTEAELCEISVLKRDMLVWVMTEEEELEFV